MIASHFIEQFVDVRNGKLMNSAQPLEIKNLKHSLDITKASPTLVTIAVWKIKFKPGYPIVKEQSVLY